ncbi:MAG TPA: ABC transporter permease [Gemmatimonadaceae bacterium]|nr:ABC transporter permease [Gemmatimonadaceae bacterium]
MRRDRSAVFAGLLLLAIALPCVLAPVAAPYDPTAQPGIVDLQSRPPSPAHPLGTDSYSRDVLSRLLYGGRLSLGVAIFATLVSVTLGTAYGAATGYSHGMARIVLERGLDTLLSIPRLLLLIAIFAAWRDISLTGFVVMLGITGWYGLARLVRGQVLALKAQDFIASARGLGATPTRIFFRHVLPNVVTPVVVAATLGIGHVIVLEAGLSYLGIGVHPPTPSWGNMIQDGSDQIFAGQWWVSLFPGLAIVLTVMAFNVLGDSLLRALQPRQTFTG